jgi:hypothetical protein
MKTNAWCLKLKTPWPLGDTSSVIFKKGLKMPIHRDFAGNSPLVDGTVACWRRFSVDEHRVTRNSGFRKTIPA